jgi:nucleoside-diphosphate-sugar epimerase
MATISFLGCGWLGFPLAQKLYKLGHRIKASSTDLEKCTLFQNEGFEFYLIDIYTLNQYKNLKDFFNTDILIVTIPFRRNLEDPNVYAVALEAICNKRPVQHCLFTSSTSVYNPNQKLCDEKGSLHDSPRAQALIKTEQFFMEQMPIQNTVLRLGGLYGPGREPSRFLRGKKDLSNAKNPVNLVHLYDVVNICIEVIQQKAWGYLLNVVSDNHPTREDFYKAEAERLGVDSPHFIEESSLGGKIVDNALLKRVLGVLLAN